VILTEISSTAIHTPSARNKQQNLKFQLAFFQFLRIFSDLSTTPTPPTTTTTILIILFLYFSFFNFNIEYGELL